jgi:hypothetical protein
MFAEFIDMFRKPNPEALAESMLLEAKVNLLKTQQTAEYFAKLAEYHAQTVQRLEKPSCSQPSNISLPSLTKSSTMDPLTKALRSHLYATPISSQ